MLDQAKMVMKMKKLQKELSKEIIEAEAGDGAVVVKINGEQKIKKIEIDPESIDLDDIAELEKWVEEAVSGFSPALPPNTSPWVKAPRIYTSVLPPI